MKRKKCPDCGGQAFLDSEPKWYLRVIMPILNAWGWIDGGGPIETYSGEKITCKDCLQTFYLKSRLLNLITCILALIISFIPMLAIAFSFLSERYWLALLFLVLLALVGLAADKFDFFLYSLSKKPPQRG